MVNSVSEKTFKELEERYNIKYLIKNTVIISYPKSGRTWLRMILAKLLVNMGYDHSEYEMIPVFHKGCKEIADLFSKDINIIFLHRNPVDTSISYWREMSSSWRSGLYYQGDRSAYLRNEFIGGIKQIIGFNNEWIVNKYFFNKFLGVSYYMLHKNPAECLKAICHITDLKANEKHIKEAIEYSSRENMKKIENGEGINYLEYYKGNFGKHDPNASYVHTEELDGTKNIVHVSQIPGRVGPGKYNNYHNLLDEEDIKYAEECLKKSKISYVYNDD